MIDVCRVDAAKFPVLQNRNFALVTVNSGCLTAHRRRHRPCRRNSFHKRKETPVRSGERAAGIFALEQTDRPRSLELQCGGRLRNDQHWP